MIGLDQQMFNKMGYHLRKFSPLLMLIGLISIGFLSVRSSPAPRVPSVDVKSVDYGTCIDRAKGIDGVMEQCADSEISRIMDLYDRLRGAKSGSNLDISKASPFDDRRWNEFVIAHCLSEIRKDTGVSSYLEYGTMERMLYRMCVLDQTKIRLESVIGQLAKQPAEPKH